MYGANATRRHCAAAAEAALLQNGRKTGGDDRLAVLASRGERWRAGYEVGEAKRGTWAKVRQGDGGQNGEAEKSLIY